ncbi:MAG: twin-arginine translocase subunit TatC [Kiritimatiellae bacterium]|nr:twin-arginine translocase subunit TatC [Kiritimatiellia bacterium]
MNPPDEAASRDAEVKPFLEHLEDLRRMLIRCIIALALAMLVCIPFTPGILDLLKAPLGAAVSDPDRFLRSLEVVGAFSITMRIAFWSGLLLSAPLLLLFIGAFVFPGLKQREKEVVLKASGFAIGLFVLGVLIGYFLTLPVALRLMFRWHEWLGVRAEWVVTSYVAFATQLLIGFGLAFELPVVVLVLGRLGIVNSDQLRAKRRHVIVLALVIGMLLTPPDVPSQLIMAIPLVLLYEICIWIVWAGERRDRRGEGSSP